MLNIGRIHQHRRESALEGRVLLDVLAVLIEGGRTNRLELASRQHWLENAGSVDCTFRRTGADERVHFIDKQNDVATGLDFLQHLLQALFEITAVTAAGDQGTKVERVQLLVLESLRHFPTDDVLSEPFDDRGLAYAGLADQHGVVLRAPGEHLHHALDLLRSPDHRIELSLACRRSQVPTELIKHERR